MIFSRSIKKVFFGKKFYVKTYKFYVKTYKKAAKRVNYAWLLPKVMKKYVF